MRTLALLFASILLLASNAACFRNSTVVKIAKDGSGEITVRYYFSPEVVAMLDQVQALGAQGLGADAGPALAGIAAMRDLLEPQAATLEADAENFGEGVVYRTHEAGADASGWQGYTVVYAFDDVNKVTIDQNAAPSSMKSFAESMGQDLAAQDGGEVSFRMADGVLSVSADLGSMGLEDIADDEQFAAANQLGMRPSEVLKTAADSMSGMRMGVFLRIDGEIAETDASHVNGTLITLSDAEMDKVFSDEGFLGVVDAIVADPAAFDAERVKEAMAEVDGVTLETKETITVRFR